MRLLVLLAVIVMQTMFCNAQGIDPDLERVKNRLDSLYSFKAKLKMEVDISFINMPVKYANIQYQKGKDLRFDSEDFVLLPKKGLDFTLGELFKYPFITVDRGTEQGADGKVKVLNVIPTSDKAEFSIATLWLDIRNNRLLKTEVSSKDNGIFQTILRYTSPSAALPEQVEVSFEVEKVRIPLNFMGRDTDIDRKQMRSEGKKKGRIIMDLDVTDLQLLP